MSEGGAVVGRSLLPRLSSALLVAAAAASAPARGIRKTKRERREGVKTFSLYCQSCRLMDCRRRKGGRAARPNGAGVEFMTRANVYYVT